MLAKNILLIASLVLIVGGVPLLIFGDTRGPEPQVECAEVGKATSGFSTDECPDGTTIESQKDWFEWNSTPRYGRIAGLVMILLGLLSGIISLITHIVIKRKSIDRPV